MRKFNLFLGITIVLLFMIPAMTAFGMTTSPAAINGDLISVSATPATIAHTNAIMDATNACDITYRTVSLVDSKTGADLITANITIDVTALNTGIDVASAANYMKTNGKDVDGANITITRDADTAVANAIHSSADGYTFMGNTADIRSTNGADAQQFKSEVAFVLKIETSSDANVDNNSSVEYAMTNTRTDLSGLVTTLKKPINLVENNTGAITSNFMVDTAINTELRTLIGSTDATAFKVFTANLANDAANPATLTVDNTHDSIQNAVNNTPMAISTIEYSIPQAGQKVRTLINENQVATYRTAGTGATTAAVEQIAMTINSAANTYFTDITDTDLAQNQETAYANDLVAAANNTLLTAAGITGNAAKTMADNSLDANLINTDTAMTRPATTIYSDITMGIAGAGLALNFA